MTPSSSSQSADMAEVENGAGSRKLRFGFGRDVPLERQSERAECGLACVSMVAGFHGHQLELPDLRRRYPVSQKGMSASDIIDVCAELGLAGRALKVEIDELARVASPAILHWNMNHFVVLVKVRGDKFLIHDPARGAVLLSREALAESFTGIAIETIPAKTFKPEKRSQRFSAFSLLDRLGDIKGILSFVFFLGLMLEFLALLTPLANQYVVDQAVVSLDIDLVIALAIGMSILLAAQVGLSAYREWVVVYVSTKVGVHMTTSIFKHLLSVNLEYFQKRPVGDIVTRFDSVVFLQRVLTTGIVEALLDGVLVLGTFAMMSFYSPLFATLSLVACLIYLGFRYLLFKSLYRFSDTQLACAARRESAFLETIRAIQPIALFRRQHDRLGHWLNATIDEQNASLHIKKHSVLFRSANSLLFGLDGIVFMALAAKAIMSGQFSVGMLFAMTSYKMQFSSRVVGLIDKSFEFRLLRVHVRRISEIISEPPEERMVGMPLPQNLEPTIEVRNLAFRHSRTEPFVFRNLNMSVNAGECVSIIGPSGCGKSSLIKLLVGATQPTEGEIRIGGIPLPQIRSQIVGGFMTAVMQGDPLLSGTVLENISFFDDKPDFDHVIACAKLAGIHEEILDMPMGYQTLLGDMGSVLSGGEKQRLLLARALYPRPRILILDEATANIDIHREREINARLSELRITRIIIAHRRETCMSTDRQMMFRELLSKKGVTPITQAAAV